MHKDQAKGYVRAVGPDDEAKIDPGFHWIASRHLRWTENDFLKYFKNQGFKDVFIKHEKDHMVAVLFGQGARVKLAVKWNRDGRVGAVGGEGNGYTVE